MPGGHEEKGIAICAATSARLGREKERCDGGMRDVMVGGRCSG